jgi:protein ImuB
MPLAEAKSLVPDAKIAKYDPAADRQALSELAEACEQFSPCVAIEEGDAPECLLLDISNLEHLWGSEAELAALAEAFFVRRGWRVQVAVAETVGVAWGAARFGKEFRISDCGLKGSNPQSAITQLPIEALRIGAETAALLRELGIETVEQVFALPREELSSRFGEELLRRLDQWAGAAAEVLRHHRPPAALVVGCSLEHPTADRAALAHVLGQLVNQLAARLAARDEGAVVLVCELGCVDKKSVPLSISLFEPSACPRQLMELVGLHLETVTLAAEVVHVEIRAATVGRLGQRQGELFADGWSSDTHQLAVLVNRLSSRLGGERVLRAEPRASAAPERAVRWVPMAGTKNFGLRIADCGLKRKIRNPGCPLGAAIRNGSPIDSARPLLLYPEPRPLDVICVSPDGPPQGVWLDGRRERIARHAGPERIETLWWRGRSVRRDYYRVATEAGSHLWIFRRLGDGRWFVHGVFS